MSGRLSILWHYAEARRRFVRWQDPTALKIWQEAKVKRHIGRVAARSSYFRDRLDACGLENWREWPVSRKADMMQHFNQWNTAGIRLEDAWALAVKAERERDFSATLNGITVGLSSGTSGSRGLFLASEDERRLWAGMLLARVLEGTLLQEHRAALFLRADSSLYQTVGSRRFQFSFFDLYQPLEQHWPRLRSLRPTLLAAPPSVLSRLAGSFQLAPPAILLSVADVLDAADRERIELGFGCQAGQIYQATEGFLAATCPFGRLHWNEDAVVVQKEWLDAAHTRYAPIITDFRRFTQPILRYRLDDVIVDDDSPCPCGSVFGVLGSVEGRCDDVLSLPKLDGSGEVALFPDFVRRAILLAVPTGVDYAVVQTSLDRLEVSFSQSCALEPVQREVDDLCRALRAKAPFLRVVPWTPVALPAKRRRVRRQMPEPVSP